MSGFLAQAWKGFQLICVTAVLLLAVLAIWLFATGSLSKGRVNSAWQALRGKKPEPGPGVPGPIEEEWKKLEEHRAKTELTLRKREEELKNLETRTKLDLAQLEIERQNLNAAREEAEKMIAAVKKEKDDLAAKKIDAVTQTNLTIFEEMKGQDLSALMAGWSDNAEVIRYLRLLSADKAAEVLKAMGLQGSPWRKLPEGGGPTRYDRIVEALKG